ncbi:MAG: Stp1/IreP family PP2C-type Ser/Thr phosphatase [Acutalibacteraceae bacterium]
MEVFLKSDIGLVRSTNQDACTGGVFSGDAAWAVVCDGMGGANGGNVASSVAVKEISRRLKRGYRDSLTDDEIVDLLTDIVQKANSKLYKIQKNDPELRGMGTTVELVLVKGNKLHVVHAGDSRVYSIRGRRIKQLTIDHSVVQEMVEKGEITSEQAMAHPNKNIITRALGIVPEIHLDYIEGDFKENDYVVICTDGLSNYIKPAEFVRMARTNYGEQYTQALVDSAKELGGSDNITVAVIANSSEVGED